MSVPTFLDTNILLYADDRADPQKQERAKDVIRKVMRDRSGRISLQVLQEYFSAATRKLGIDAAIARRKVELYSRLDVVRLQPSDLLAAIDLHRLHQFSIWDALILRAALISGCRMLYTEDLQPGFRLDRLTVVNPLLTPLA
jgi:predicted nucleic acid-binding protein